MEKSLRPKKLKLNNEENVRKRMLDGKHEARGKRGKKEPKKKVKKNTLLLCLYEVIVFIVL